MPRELQEARFMEEGANGLSGGKGETKRDGGRVSRFGFYFSTLHSWKEDSAQQTMIYSTIPVPRIARLTLPIQIL